MSDVIYLDVDAIIRINQTVGGRGAGIRDLSLIEGAVGRPQNGYGGVDAHPGIFGKAAALLHGLAATQGFFDGNKRTAWAAAETFLQVNGWRLKHIATIEAELAVLAASQNGFEPGKLAEWLKRKSLSRSFPKFYRGPQTISLLEEVAPDGTIRNTLFDGVTLTGPSVLFFMTPPLMIGCSWIGDLKGFPDCILWPVPPTNITPGMFGCIGLMNCELRNCQFDGVGIAGEEDLLAVLTQSFSVGRPR